MWRSIQTLYLGIATALMAALFFCRFATIIGPDGAEETIRYYEKTPYLVLMIMTLTAHICSVFSYKLRFLQARVCIITALLALGGPAMWDFSITMLLGIFIGTYSSVYIASPVVLYFDSRGDLRKELQEADSAADV